MFTFIVNKHRRWWHAARRARDCHCWWYRPVDQDQQLPRVYTCL